MPAYSIINPPSAEEVYALCVELNDLLTAEPDDEKAAGIAISVQGQMSAMMVPSSHPVWRLCIAARLNEEINKLKSNAPCPPSPS